MTSTGNTAQKIIIECFYMNTDQTRAEGITRHAISKAQTQEQKNTIKRIAKKFYINIK